MAHDFLLREALSLIYTWANVLWRSKTLEIN